MYEFRDKTAKGNIDGGPQHAAELPYLWGTNATSTLTAQQQLSRGMIAYWARFARTGALKVHGLPSVPRYSPSAPHEVAFDSDGPAIVNDMAANHQCAFWNPIFPDRWSFHFSPGQPLAFR
jgi:para-nitrobenzyl esterase